jgi:2-dehydro-3-deoxyphosphogluconate aldolase/(4S)-4-hydroxy-2-oxoglutarate aldolase
MNKEAIRARIIEVGIIAGVRVSEADLALFAAEAIYEAGIPIVEITMTVPGAIDLISQLTKKYPDFIVGAGTVLSEETAQRCIDAGAGFVTSPGFVPEVLEFTLKTDAVAIPGALTPSEVIAAWKEGADFVKIFPCSTVGGAPYVRSLKVPLPQIPLIASGGVNQLTARDFIFAGASALGIRSELTPRDALQTRQKQWVYELARRFTTIVREARAQMGAM